MSDTSSPPSWTSTKKGHPCGACPYGVDGENRKCLLRGRHYPNARVTFVMWSPAMNSNNQNDPLSRADNKIGVFTKLVDKAREESDTYNVTYVVGATGKNHPKEAARQCANYLEGKLHDHRQLFNMLHFGEDPGVHVIVPMGADASKHFIPGNVAMKNMRGQAYSAQIGGFDFVVLPTLSPSHVLMQPGVARVVKRDIRKAFQIARTGNITGATDIEELARHYRFPETVEEVAALCDEIINYTDPEKQPDPAKWSISVDTETNTKIPHEPNAKVIMVSFGWDDGKAAAIPLHHPEVGYDPDEAWPHVRRVMDSAKPKIFHNAKFDLQMLTHASGVPVRNVWWDTMLEEHFLNEDLKGYYGLKRVVEEYAPEFVGYEEKLKEALSQDARILREMELPDDQDSPDVASSWELTAFYPFLEYDAACESDEAETLTQEQRKELFELELEYLEAHVDEDKKAKQSARGKINRRCKKWGIAKPDTVSDMSLDDDSDGGFENVPLPILLRYAAADADVTRRVCKKQRLVSWNRGEFRDGPRDVKIFDDNMSVLDNLLIPMTHSLSRMEYVGTQIDHEAVERYDVEMQQLADVKLAELQRLVTQSDFNPNSNPQLAVVIGDGKAVHVDHEDLEWTADGNLSIRAPWMETMREHPKYRGTLTAQFFEDLSIYRQASKASGTFLRQIRELSALDGRIHTRFNINGTTTGRLSSAAMNLQNIPVWMCRVIRKLLDENREFILDDAGHPLEEVIVPGWNIKRLFIPSTPEHVFFQLDIAAAEIRVLCAYANDEALIDALDQGLDVHSFIASNIFDPTYEEFIAGKDTNPDIKLLRTAAKRVVFGTLYGAGPWKIASQIYGSLSSDPAEKDRQVAFAQETIDLLFNKFPKIGKYVNGTKAEVNELGKVRTFFGRYRRFNMRNANFKLRNAAEREAVNFKIQSTSSDLVMSQLVEVDEHFHEIDGRLLLTVHDSIAGEIHRDRVGEMTAFFDHWIVDRIAEKFPWMPVPFKYDLEVGPNYGELADIASLDVMRKRAADRSAKEVKLLKKAKPILEAAGLWEGQEVRDAS